jgi:pimeloyl-ACP methyl ester carboxylesterase
MVSSSTTMHANGATILRRFKAAVRLILGGEADLRTELRLLGDYDPGKRPIIMIHGLGGDTQGWNRLADSMLDCEDLCARYQVWQVAYHASAPLLVIRRRVQQCLDATWERLDPAGTHPARSGIVLIGHSMGGVIARMLCAESHDIVWQAAFTVPPHALQIDAQDAARIEETFRFHPYPGVRRAIFLAAPHGGSPAADEWLGRLFRTLLGGRTPELKALRRLANEYPEVVRVELRAVYQKMQLNSIHTMRLAQPVRRAGESLMPAAGIPYHTIAAELPGSFPRSDGVVPLSSALLPGAASTLVVESAHDVYDHDQAVAEVLRILREDLASPR